MPIAATPEEREERRSQVAVMLLGHARITAMAQALGVDRHTIQTDIKAIRDDWKMARTEAYDRWSAEELPKLEQLERAIWSKAMNGDGWAVERVLQIMDFRAKFIGLYAPTKQEVLVLSDDLLEQKRNELLEERERRLRLVRSA